MGLVDQDVSISRLSCIHVYHCFVRILHRPRLNPRFDPLLRRQLQHLLNLVRSTDSASADLAALCDQREGVECWHAIFGRADLNECAVGAEERQILFEWHVGRGDCADNEIEGASVVGGPVFVIVCCNVLVCSNLHRILLLCRRPAYGGDAISSEGLSQVSRFSVFNRAIESTLA